MSLEARINMQLGGFDIAAEFTAPDDRATALFGPSGAGKTSILRAIAGLERPEKAYIAVNGEIWQEGRHFLPPHKRAVGFVFQDTALLPHLDVEKNLDFGEKRTPASERRIRRDDVITFLKLEKLLGRSPGKLSGGERQRVAIGRALLTSPKLLLLDEPLSALDARGKAEILPLLQRLRQEFAIPMLYVSHALDEVARITSRMILLDEGSVLASGSTSQVLTSLDQPLAHADDASAVIAAQVAGHEDEWRLTVLEFSGGKMLVPRADAPIGAKVRLRIRARDVSLALKRHKDTSILNILPVKVAGIAETSPSQCVVRLDAGTAPLLARITHKSRNALELVEGKKLYAQVKAVSLLM